MNHWGRSGGGVHCSVCGVEFANVFARNAHAASHAREEPLASDDADGVSEKSTDKDARGTPPPPPTGQ